MYTYTMTRLCLIDIHLSRDRRYYSRAKQGSTDRHQSEMVSILNRGPLAFLTKLKVLCCTLFLGMIITGFMKEDNRRQAADQERANSIVTSQLLESKSNREDFSEKI